VFGRYARESIARFIGHPEHKPHCGTLPQEHYIHLLRTRMEGVHGSGGATSPATSGRPGTAGDSYKRKRSGAEFESSPGTGGDGEGEGEEEEESKRRQPGVKRACNECRQQKASADRRFSPGKNPPTGMTVTVGCHCCREAYD
jgi:hypothetical protein